MEAMELLKVSLYMLTKDFKILDFLLFLKIKLLKLVIFKLVRDFYLFSSLLFKFLLDYHQLQEIINIFISLILIDLYLLRH